MHTKHSSIIRADRVIGIPEETNMADSFYSQEGKVDKLMEEEKRMPMVLTAKFGQSRATNATSGDMQEGIV
eukprot:72225-Ditylum_brightwellii.AAC.1